jgi:hypothetical protein
MGTDWLVYTRSEAPGVGRRPDESHGALPGKSSRLPAREFRILEDAWERAPRRHGGIGAGRTEHGVLTGVGGGIRTHDHWNHNPALYQLSYTHRIGNNYQSIKA